MAENTDIAPAKEKELNPAKLQEAAFVGDESIRSPLPEMKGRVNRHTSGYWALAIPALSVRYLAEATADVVGFTRQRLAKSIKLPWVQKLAALPITPEGNKDASRMLDKVEAPVVGAFMMGVSTLYMGRTYKDLKGAFAEAISWETGKKKEDIGFMDIMKSDNTLVEAARRNFLKYNVRRFAVNTPFFSHWVFDKAVKPKGAILFGVASNSIYLMSDVLSRKETFFERLQSFVDEKVLHTEKLGEQISAIDLINLYELHSRDKNSNYRFTGRMDTKEWQDRVKVFGRMADLMNETYGNQTNPEKANFTLSKMIYLMGHGMITSGGDPDRSCAYIEVANKYGIDAVKEMASKNIADGSDLAYGREKYPTSQSRGEKPCLPASDEKAQGGFAAKFAQSAEMSKGDKVLTQRAAANEATRTTTI